MGDMAEIYKEYNKAKKEERHRKEDQRFEYALKMLNKYFVTLNGDNLKVKLQHGTITFYPYTGWFCGQKPYGKIKGRGIHNFIKELEKLK